MLNFITQKMCSMYANFLIFIVFFVLICNFSSSFAQTQTRGYTISSGCSLSINGKGQQLYSYIVDNKMQNLSGRQTTKDIYVDFDLGLVDFGDKQDSLNPALREILTGFDTQYDECIEKPDVSETQTMDAPKETNFWTPFIYIPLRIAKNWDFRYRYTNQTRYLSSPDYFVNPYFQAFGGEPLGIPLSYGIGLGLTIGFGTQYSGPLETDYIKGGLHFTWLEVAVTGRIKEFVQKYSANTNRTEDLRSSWLGNWNNLFAPHLGIEFAAELPWVRVSYFSTIDTLQDVTDNPIIVKNEVTGEPMKNNVVRGEYFNFELRTPNIIFYNSTRAKFYFAKQFGEYHLGYAGREMKIDNFIFDLRIDATFPGKREFQLLTELYWDSPWIGFANKAFGIGPSLRLGKTPSNNFGIITAFINARVKIGDFFDKNIF